MDHRGAVEQALLLELLLLRELRVRLDEAGLERLRGLEDGLQVLAPVFLDGREEALGLQGSTTEATGRG